MGLHSWCYKTREPVVEKFKIMPDATLPIKGENHFADWDRRWDLQNWMLKLVAESGFQEEDTLSGVCVYLNANDLARLAYDMTIGAFYEDDNHSWLEWLESDLCFVAEARRAIAKGYSVFYVSAY